MEELPIENDVYPEEIDLKTYKEEKRCYWAIVILEQNKDDDVYDSMPEFLNDVHLFEKVLFIIADPEKLTSNFAETLMDLNNMYVRAKPDPDVVNEFPMNVFFAQINDYKKFFSTHLSPLRKIFPQIHEDSQILRQNILCVCSQETFERINCVVDHEKFNIQHVYNQRPTILSDLSVKQVFGQDEMIKNIDVKTKKIMKDAILKYFLQLRGIFEILEHGSEEEIKKQAMDSNKTFLVDYVREQVAKQTSDQRLIDEVTCLIIYDLIANFVLLPAQRVSQIEVIQPEATATDSQNQDQSKAIDQQDLVKPDGSSINQKEEVKLEQVKVGQQVKTEEVVCDDMCSLHFDIVFKRVTTVEQIKKREKELEINPDYIRSLPKDIKEAISSIESIEEEKHQDLAPPEKSIDYKDHVQLPKEIKPKLLFMVQFAIENFIYSFQKNKYDSITKIGSFHNQLANQIKNQATSKITKQNVRHDELDFYKSIQDPSNSKFSYLLENNNKDQTMLNLILLNVERWMLACSLFQFTQDSTFSYNEDLIKAFQNLKQVQLSFKEDLLECSFTIAQKFMSKTREELVKSVLPEHFKSLHSYFQQVLPPDQYKRMLELSRSQSHAPLVAQTTEKKPKQTNQIEKAPVYSTDNTPDIVKYEFMEITNEQLQEIWDPERNPLYKKQLETQLKQQPAQPGQSQQMSQQ